MSTLTKARVGKTRQRAGSRCASTTQFGAVPTKSAAFGWFVSAGVSSVIETLVKELCDRGFEALL